MLGVNQNPAALVWKENLPDSSAHLLRSIEFTAWDGTVTMEEYVSRFAFGGGLGMKGFAGEMGIETMELVRKSYADSIGKVLIGAFGKPIDLA